MTMTSGKNVGLAGNDYKWNDWKARPWGRGNEEKTKNDDERARCAVCRLPAQTHT